MKLPKIFILVIAAAVVLADKSTRIQNDIQNANFDLLLGDKSPKSTTKKSSFFDFPEAKFLAEKKMNSDLADASPVVNTPESLMAQPAKGFGRKLQKKVRSTPHPNDIKLSDEVNKLLPDVSELLKGLKPRKPRALSLKQPKQAAKKSQPSKGEAPSDLKAFDKFSEEVKSSETLSNRKLIQNFERGLNSLRAEAEENYQSFIAYATQQYTIMLSKAFTEDQQEFEQMQERTAANLKNSIEQGVKNQSKKIDAELQRRFRRITRRKFQLLTNDIEAMSKFYNKIFAEDQKYVNKMTQIDVPVPRDPKVWEAKDGVYLTANLKPDIKKKGKV